MMRKRFIPSVLLSALCGFAFSAVSHAAIELPGGTEVVVVFQQEVSSKYVKPGDMVPIRLQGDITVGGITVVKDGCPGNARVKNVEKAGKPGKAGRVEVDLVELTPNGSYTPEKQGQTIKLEAVHGTITAKGKGKALMSWIFIFGLFIKGGEGVIPADLPFAAKVKDDIMLEVQ
jgi:hypothetical protein